MERPSPVTLPGMTALTRLVQFLNAPSPMFVTEPGIMTVVSSSHELNAAMGIFVIPSGKMAVPFSTLKFIFLLFRDVISGLHQNSLKTFFTGAVFSVIVFLSVIVISPQNCDSAIPLQI